MKRNTPRSAAKTVFGLAIVGVVTSGLGLVVAPALADYAPGPHDIVGVGGDTPQFDLAFGADGDAFGNPGYNSAGNVYKLVTFNATPDGNARAAYANGSTESAPLPLNATDTLRAGTAPVQRVQSSGDAITALLADTAKPETINFVFSASVPTTAQQSTAGSNGWGYLHVVQLGTDAVQIVGTSTTHSPAGLSIQELLGIYKGTYTNWNQLPGNANGSTDKITPLLPPASSSITKTFLADLKTANGGTAPTLSNPNIQTVEQNDPTALTGSPNAANAIIPFSSARLKLFVSGYFHSATTKFPGGAVITPGAAALTGAAPDAGAVYSSPVNHYVIFRQSDATSTVAWQPGGTRNWVQELFSGTHAFFNTTAGLADIAAGGTTPKYSDLGNVSAG